MKIVNVAGARPNFMKIAPLMRSMHSERHKDRLTSLLVHTGQHYDEAMSRVFFDELDIPRPDVNLEVGSGSREEQIEKVMQTFDRVMLQEKPDAVLVVGDVNSTIACARVAKDRGAMAIHVEAGLRSFDQEMPEEINRIETDQISDLLFVTEASGMDNLRREAIAGDAFLTGNVMIDTLVYQLERIGRASKSEQLGLLPGGYFVGTFHRPSNVDHEQPLANVLRIIRYAAEHLPVVLPLHPRTRNALVSRGWLEQLSDHPKVIITEPLGYMDFLTLMRDAKGVVTDSGGVQEETTYLGVPCITMRDNTERPVTVELGTNVLAGTNPERVLEAIDDVLSGAGKKGAIPPLWDGHAASRIVDIIADR